MQSFFISVFSSFWLFYRNISLAVLSSLPHLSVAFSNLFRNIKQDPLFWSGRWIAWQEHEQYKIKRFRLTFLICYQIQQSLEEGCRTQQPKYSDGKKKIKKYTLLDCYYITIIEGFIIMYLKAEHFKICSTLKKFIQKWSIHSILIK